MHACFISLFAAVKSIMKRKGRVMASSLKMMRLPGVGAR